MTKRSNTKRTLVSSVIALMLSFVMLLGTTFAWFTDNVTSANNKIVAGNLDVQLLMHDGSDYKDISDTEGSIFGGADSIIAQNKNTDTLWEPGKTQVAYLAIKNNGSLALKYSVALQVMNPAEGKNLYEVMEYVITPDANVQDNKVESWTYAKGNGIVKTAELGTNVVSDGEGHLQKGETHYFALSVHMMESAGNEYQDGQIDFDLTVVATQLNSESDSFGPDYDAQASWPMWLGEVDYEWDGEGTKEAPYLISSEAELAGLAKTVNGTTKARATANDFKGKYFKLTKDVDLANQNWEPIGKSDATFKGNFDGGNHTVSNLFISTKASYVGLFGYTTEGTVKNLKVHNAIIQGRLGVGVVSGCPYTTSYDNITVTGDVKIDAAFYVGGVVGRNAYANLTNITVNVNEGSYVKANSVDNGTTYRTYVGGVVGFMGEGGHKVENVTSNIDVIGSTIDVGGIAGIAHYGNQFINCTSTGDVTLTDLGDPGDNLEIGGIAGVWHNASGTKVTLTNCTYTGKLTSPEVTAFPYNGLVGKAYDATGTGQLIVDGEDVTGTYSYAVVTTDAQLETALKSNAEYINVVLRKDVSLNVSDAYIKLGGADTKEITILGDGHQLTLSTTYWSRLNLTNPNATLYLSNLKMTSSQKTGTWNSYDVTFMCNVDMNNVDFDKAVALDGEIKAMLHDVTIKETHDYYGLWIVAGADVEMSNCSIASEGRGIKISDEYVDAPTLTNLSVKDSAFETKNKAAILVGSKAGAKITLSNVNIDNVEKDSINTVWVDEDWAAYSNLVTVTGGNVIVEP